MPRLRTDYCELVARDERRLEEREALNMIPVGVANGDERADERSCRHELIAKSANACASIENNQVIVVKPDLKAGGVTSIPDSLLAWRWN
jgi:hypothetical protein